MDFYFPVLFLVPALEGEKLESSTFCIAKRQWETSIFDLATLATKHKLHLPYQAMDVFLSRCNLEIRVTGQTSLQLAITTFQAFRLALYAEGVSPFLSPFVTTHSINEYSGINSRDSDTLRNQLPDGLRVGPKSTDISFESWPFELSFECIVSKESVGLSKEQFANAVNKAELWRKITSTMNALLAIEEVVANAPKLMPLSQSVLHLWSGLEALFPSVSTELSFKIALYLTQLIASGSERMEVYESVRASYNLRSAITHGARPDVSIEEWQKTWRLLLDAVNAIMRRGKMPQEKELLTELLS